MSSQAALHGGYHTWSFANESFVPKSKQEKNNGIQGKTGSVVRDLEIKPRVSLFTLGCFTNDPGLSCPICKVALKTGVSGSLWTAGERAAAERWLPRGPGAELSRSAASLPVALWPGTWPAAGKAPSAKGNEV